MKMSQERRVVDLAMNSYQGCAINRQVAGWNDCIACLDRLTVCKRRWCRTGIVKVIGMAWRSELLEADMARTEVRIAGFVLEGGMGESYKNTSEFKYCCCILSPVILVELVSRFSQSV